MEVFHQIFHMPDTKEKVPTTLSRCEDEENYFIKYYQYYPNKSEWVPVSVSISINYITLLPNEQPVSLNMTLPQHFLYERLN